MTIITDSKTKQVDEYNELQMKHLKNRVQIMDALAVIAMTLALAVIAAVVIGFVVALVLLAGWLF